MDTAPVLRKYIVDIAPLIYKLFILILLLYIVFALKIFLNPVRFSLANILQHIAEVLFQSILEHLYYDVLLLSLNPIYKNDMWIYWQIQYSKQKISRQGNSQKRIQNRLCNIFFNSAFGRWHLTLNISDRNCDIQVPLQSLAFGRKNCKFIILQNNSKPCKEDKIVLPQ